MQSYKLTFEIIADNPEDAHEVVLERLEQGGEADTVDNRPSNCECDNTHEQNNTCCQPCWRAGFRCVPFYVSHTDILKDILNTLNMIPRAAVPAKFLSRVKFRDTYHICEAIDAALKRT